MKRIGAIAIETSAGLLFLPIICLFFLACNSGSDKNMPTYMVEKRNFINAIEIDGIVEPLEFTAISTPRQFEGTIGYLADDGIIVNPGDLICSFEMPDMQTAYEQLLMEIEKTKAEFEKRKVEMGVEYTLLQAQVEDNELNAKIIGLDSIQLEYSPQTQRRISELELQKVAIERERYKKKLKSLAIIQQSEIRKMEMQIQQRSNQAQSLKEQLESTNLRASREGLLIVETNFLTGSKFKVGDPVWGGMVVASIPEMNKMKVKIQALENDFKYINVNDSVSYQFDAMSDNFAYGKIIKKTPVGREYKQGSSVKFFEIEASIDSCLALPEPGFTTRCRIILSHMQDTIVVPQIAVFNHDSIKVVYVKNGNKFDMKEVHTGISSSKEIVITKGLVAGEVVAMEKPRESSVRKTILFPPKNNADSTNTSPADTLPHVKMN